MTAPDVTDRIVAQLQDGLAELAKALNSLTMTITIYRGEIDKSVALLQVEHAHMQDKWDQYAHFLDGNGESAATRLRVVENEMEGQRQSQRQIKGAVIAAVLSLGVSLVTWVLRGK